MYSNKNKYVPINCSFHDQLIELATLKKTIDLIVEYQNTDNVIKNVRVVDIYTSSNKEEFLTLSNGDEIRLDKVKQAGNYSAPNNNTCNF